MARGRSPTATCTCMRFMGDSRGFADRCGRALLLHALATVLGEEGDEAVHGVIEAMAAGVKASAYTRVVAIHPTVSELVPTTFGELSP